MKSTMLSNPFSSGKLFYEKKIGEIPIFKEMEEAKKTAISTLAPKKDKIIVNNDKVIPCIRALEIKTKDFLKTFDSFDKNSLQSVFNKSTVTGEMSDGSNFNSYIDLKVSKGMVSQIKIAINSIATCDKIEGTVTFQDPSAPIDFSTGNIFINGTQVGLTTGMSAQGVVDYLNFYVSSVKVQLIQQADSNFAISITSLQSGSPITISDDQAGVLLQQLGLSETGATINSLSANFSIDNVPYSRTTNIISDLDGDLKLSTLILKNIPANGATAQITIDFDREGIYKAIKDFAFQYNEVFETIKYNSDSDTNGKQVNKDAHLFGNRILRDIKSILDKIIRSTLNNQTSSINNFSDLGIKYKKFGSETALLVDDQMLNKAINNSIFDIKTFFNGEIKSSNSLFNVYSIPEQLVCQDSNGNTSNYSGVNISLSLDNSIVSINIPGLAPFTFQTTNNVMRGTEYFNNFVVIYNGGLTTDQVTLNLSSGILRKFDVSYSFKQAIDNINRENETYKKQIETKEKDIEKKYTIPDKKITQLISAERHGEMMKMLLKAFNEHKRD